MHRLRAHRCRCESLHASPFDELSPAPSTADSGPPYNWTFTHPPQGHRSVYNLGNLRCLGCWLTPCSGSALNEAIAFLVYAVTASREARCDRAIVGAMLTLL